MAGNSNGSDGMSGRWVAMVLRWIWAVLDMGDMGCAGYGLCWKYSYVERRCSDGLNCPIAACGTYYTASETLAPPGHRAWPGSAIRLGRRMDVP